MFKKALTFLFAPLAMLFGLIQQAFAAVPAEITTALGDAKTDALAVAALALVLIVAVIAFKYMRKGL